MENRARRLLRLNPDGFTLIELMISLAIFGIVMAAIYGIFISSSHSYRTQDGVADAQQRSRAGIEYMVGSIRMAGFDPRSSANAGIEIATPTTIQFTADFDMSGGIDDTPPVFPLGERINYTLVGQTLIQTSSDLLTPEPLIDMVSALTFTYWDANGNELAAVPLSAADLTLVRSVEISITCQGRGYRGDLLSRTLSNTVNCRSLGI